jgi:hypothetical protein
VSKSGFVAAALRELSVGLCRGNYLMHWASLGALAGVAGRGFHPGGDPPVEDVCDDRCFGCCRLRPLLVGFSSFELVLYTDLEHVDLGDAVFLLMSLCNIST